MRQYLNKSVKVPKPPDCSNIVIGNVFMHLWSWLVALGVEEGELSPTSKIWVKCDLVPQTKGILRVAL